mmetsp:Transcript_20777/g.45187  ORF Transcript_20777/g.45187 Transcript_20777/m.45187 type:complete len:109 (+) Transcript_20777:342-668(+)
MLLASSSGRLPNEGTSAPSPPTVAAGAFPGRSVTVLDCGADAAAAAVSAAPLDAAALLDAAPPCDVDAAALFDAAPLSVGSTLGSIGPSRIKLKRSFGSSSRSMHAVW